MLKVFASFLLILGLFLIGNAVLPIVGYEFLKKPERKLLSPLGEGEVLGKRINSPLAGDLTKASNWFVGNPYLLETPSSIRYYTLSIPKLKIDRATVEIGGEDLSESLIHYKGTANPGSVGNAVIFGHSTLPQFFNPKNYLSIFSTLPNLEVNDEILIDYDGISYKFIVREKFEVKPHEVEVLRQYHDGPHLTLITCVPPGTYLKRLVVRADLLILGI